MAAQVSLGRDLRPLLVLALFCLSCAPAAEVKAAAPSSASFKRKQQRLDVIRRHLKRLNKPAFKTIQSTDGDIIDCVHISHQPAFDHPLLKNHTIQLRPSFHPEGLYPKSAASKPNKISQTWRLNGKCPEDTIPIRRTKREDVLRASSIKRFGRKKRGTIPQPQSADPDLFYASGHEHAGVSATGDKYYGVKATINVWQPMIQQLDEFSLSQVWILGGSFAQDLNTMEAGWQVFPKLYGDNKTRLFTYWTRDSYRRTGCYNLMCSGFVQINNKIAMGGSIYPISRYGGPQYDVSILIWKDPKTGNWWMQFGQFGNDYVLGYWPSSLFSYLADSASTIEWGGEVVNSEAGGEHTSTQMGSGHFPNEGFGKASYFKNIETVDGSNSLRTPGVVGTFAEQSNCYNVQNSNGGDWGSYFYYGGPGKNPNCP